MRTPSMAVDFVCCGTGYASGGSGLSLWLIIFENTGAPDEVRNTRDVFRAHQADLERRGVIFGAGPLAEPDGKRVGRGMTILRAESAEHALESGP